MAIAYGVTGNDKKTLAHFSLAVICFATTVVGLHASGTIIANGTKGTASFCADGGNLANVTNKGFTSFNKLKNYLGSAGKGKAWHHFVEQSQIKLSGFSVTEINNVNNVVSVAHGKGSVHAMISGYYSSIPTSGFTNGLTVRQWLAGQSFEQQFKFGMDVLRQYGEVIATSEGWKFIPF